MVHDFTQFEAWKKAMTLAVKVHDLTSTFPGDEKYSLVQQMRRAAVSVVANIAEGFGRYTYADKKHKYVQARGELVEGMTFLHYSHRVGYVSHEKLGQHIETFREVHKMLNALITRLDRMEHIQTHTS